MWYRRLLTCVICLMSGFVLIGKADAGLLWKGFSGLCFEGNWKGGSVKEGELSIQIIGAVVQVQCFNLQNDGSCQPGEGNAGDITVTVPAVADPDKEKGVIVANGCIALDKWDKHSADSSHQHICQPFNNKNKIEIEDSAHISEIVTEWVLTNNGKVIRRGNQTCFWDGSIESDCKPTDNSTFTCPIDEEFRK